jgi:hypothetical protein
MEEAPTEFAEASCSQIELFAKAIHAAQSVSLPAT